MADKACCISLPVVNCGASRHGAEPARFLRCAEGMLSALIAAVTLAADDHCISAAANSTNLRTPALAIVTNAAIYNS
jgi:hypothetical protein